MCLTSIGERIEKFTFRKSNRVQCCIHIARRITLQILLLTAYQTIWKALDCTYNYCQSSRENVKLFKYELKALKNFPNKYFKLPTKEMKIILKILLKWPAIDNKYQNVYCASRLVNIDVYSTLVRKLEMVNISFPLFYINKIYFVLSCTSYELKAKWIQKAKVTTEIKNFAGRSRILRWNGFPLYKFVDFLIIWLKFRIMRKMGACTLTIFRLYEAYCIRTESQSFIYTYIENKNNLISENSNVTI